jgi:hypothetical protein
MERFRRNHDKCLWKSQKYYKVALSLTNEVEPVFAEELGRKARFFADLKCYRKYRHIFVKVWGFLEELRGEHHNSMEQLIEDYLTSIYKRWAYHKKMPFLQHISPSDNNKNGYLRYIQELEDFYSEPYWTVQEPDVNRAKSLVRAHKKGANVEVCEAQILDI